MTNKPTLMGKVQGMGLRALTQIASSEVLDTYGLRTPAEQLLYQGSKVGFEFASKASKFMSFGKSKSKKDALALIEHTPKPSDLFDLSLTEEQTMVRESISRFAKEMVRPEAHHADETHAISESLLEASNDLGLNYYAVPEAHGGYATTDNTTTHMLALEDLGHGDFSLAIAMYAPISVANVIRRYGSQAQQEKLLPKFVRDVPVMATLACTEPTPRFNPNHLETVAKPKGVNFVISGEKSLVVMAKDSQFMIVSAMYKSKPALFVVENTSTGLTIIDEPAMGLKPAKTCRVILKDVMVTPDDMLLNVNYQEFLDLGALALCSVTVGTCQAVLDYVIPYVNERVAFGEPISHRQSVAFMIADMAIEIDAMRLMVWRACALAEKGKPFHREAHLARILCANKSMKIGTDGVQLLGGHGFTKEHPVERWYRDLRAMAVMHNIINL